MLLLFRNHDSVAPRVPDEGDHLFKDWRNPWTRPYVSTRNPLPAKTRYFRSRR